jgi:mono/diheme cytochrome c family protein
VRRAVSPIVVLAAFAALAAGCTSSRPYGHHTVGPLPTSYDGSAGTKKSTLPAVYLHGDPTAGKQVFLSAGCTGCHTLKDAGATGTVGPNLDNLKPPLSIVVPQVINGGTTMPSFKKSLSAKQIADVAAYVVKATGG